MTGSNRNRTICHPFSLSYLRKSELLLWRIKFKWPSDHVEGPLHINHQLNHNYNARHDHSSIHNNNWNNSSKTFTFCLIPYTGETSIRLYGATSGKLIINGDFKLFSGISRVCVCEVHSTKNTRSSA